MPTRYFHIYELVQPEILNQIGEEKCWEQIPQHICDSLDRIREAYGKPIGINSAKNSHCGLRTQDCAIGAPFSDHKIINPNSARAFDLHCSDLPALRKLITAGSMAFKIFRMENEKATPTWIHVSYYLDPNRAVGTLNIFSP